MYPPVLADRGLADAVRALALDTPIRTETDIDLPGRLEQPVESACYFAIAEALTNAVKHSGARLVQIRIRHAGRPGARRAADRGHRQRDRRRRPGPRQRPAGCGAAAGHLRWHPGREQPGRRPDHHRHGGTVRACRRRGPLPAEGGAGPAARGARLRDRCRGRQRARACCEALLEHKPDVAVVDVRLPPSFTDDGLRAAIEARRQIPGLPVLVLSQYVEQLYARELLADQAGAVGYLLKDRVFNDDQFVDAIRTVAAGGTVMDPRWSPSCWAAGPRTSRSPG